MTSVCTRCDFPFEGGNPNRQQNLCPSCTEYIERIAKRTLTGRDGHRWEGADDRD